MSIKNGVLYVVATPIGNLDDLSNRAVRILSEVDLIAAEDTRHTSALLRYYGINTPMMAFHEHNERAIQHKLLKRLEAGESIALVSDAGTPLVSDPGYHLVYTAREEGFKVSPVPGVSALICALSASGMPSDRFVFEGFPPRSSGRRREWLSNRAQEGSTWIFYESSHRIQSTLEDLRGILGDERKLVVARELTKLYETFLYGTAGEVCSILARDNNQQKGEFVVLVHGAERPEADAVSESAAYILKVLSAELPLKQASSLAAKISGEKKNRLYELGLSWKKQS